ncbi:MAG: hypothetical protein ACJ76R_13260 [Solirubrobacteraceae bacterium]
MRRLALIVAASLASLAVPAQAAESPEAARLIRCHPHLSQAKRFAIFEGEMTGSTMTRMEIRFDLLRADPGGEFLRVEAPGLGVWNRAEAGVVDYRYRKRVENLPAPASYRALVRFRWRKPGGGVVRRGHALTEVCEQPDETITQPATQVLPQP